MHIQHLVNGKSDGCLTPQDRGLAYGDGVFRTMRVLQGVAVSWRRHYRKLSGDCNALGIVCPAEDILLSDIEHLCSDNADCVIKIVVTRGESTRGYAVPPLAQPTRIVSRSAFPSYPPESAAQGVNLYLCRLRLSSQPILAGIKHLNRLENVLARMEWNDPDLADGLLRDQSDNVIECTMSNLFMRCGMRLMTPDLGQCGVAGVTRERIIEVATTIGYEISIGNFKLDTLLDADEVIICNSLIGVWQVRQLGERRWPAGSLAEKLRPLLIE